MSRSRPIQGIPLPSSTHSSSFAKPSRPMPPVTQTSVAAIARSINSGSMNISTRTNIPPRTSIRVPQPLHEGTVRSTSINTQRTRLLSRERPIDQTNGTDHGYDEQPAARSTVTVYSISSTHQRTASPSNPLPTSKPTSVESPLSNGGLCGLRNLGNTCFMNSVLQCLSNTKPLLLSCLDDNLDAQLNKSGTSVLKGALMREYAALIRAMWLSPNARSVVSPSSFKDTIGKFAPRFTGYSEQDSQEFLRYLLQGLSEDVNRVRQKPVPPKIDEKQEERMSETERARLSWRRCLLYEDSRLVDIFAGQLKSTLECSYCQYRSITFDMFWDLSIPLPRDKSSTSLYDCIQLFMHREELDGNEKPMCAKCKQKRPCTKQLSIQKCPEILVLHLKRFSESYGRSKLNTFVDFPISNLRLGDLRDVVSDSHEGPVPTYSLVGISNHSGSVYTGHYVAQCKHPFTHEWHEFNDGSVRPISDETRVVSANAYVLFYQRNSP